jgi:outer membrane receptor protein involved in Fe transport
MWTLCVTALLLLQPQQQQPQPSQSQPAVPQQQPQPTQPQQEPQPTQPQNPQLPVVKETVIVKGTPSTISTDPSANANATVLRGQDLDALSDNPDEIEAQLKALAGASAGPSGPRIYVDGFTGGKLPPKSSIAEIRVNLNPYSAEYDAPGTARIEVITKPGGQTVHGRVMADLNRPWMNSRNPFSAEEPAFRSGSITGSIEGPLGKSASFSFNADRIAVDDASVVTAIGLDDAFRPAPIHDTVPSTHDTLQLNPRVDAQLPRNHTLSVRYLFHGVSDSGSGVGQFALPTQAFDPHKIEHDLQVSDLHVLSKQTMNDMRAQLRRSLSDQTPVDVAPQTNVLGAFTGGGNAAGAARSRVDHLELQDTVTASRGSHLIKVGGRLRVDAASDFSSQNTNGTFTFASIDAYRITEQGLAQGLSPDAIRAAGGGASQFSIVYGHSVVAQTTTDAGLFAEDDWRVRDRVTVGMGLRYETQTGIAGLGDLAPRGSVAWAIGTAKKTSAPTTVLRAGGGVFYDRVPQSLFLQSMRLDGTTTRQFIVPAPDFYPSIPPAAVLAASEHTPTPYTIDPAITPPRTVQAGVTLERKLAAGTTAAVGYLRSRGSRQLYSRVVDGAYLFTSGGRFNENQFTATLTMRTSGPISLTASYALSSARGDTSGATSFPSNPQDLEADYGRTPFDIRHHLTVFMGINGPGFRIVPSLFLSSGQPFDITVGQDLNGDSIFNDRPAFATDLSRPSVIVTPFGTFDTALIPGQRIIPRNYGIGPAQALVTLRAMKPFVVHQHDTIRIDLLAINLLNRPNLALPVGNLSSPVFGQSTGLASGSASSSNRQFRVQLQWLF